MRDKAGTKATAEAALRELPSVLGAFVQEDINGHPREVHLLVGPGQNPRDLALDVRSLLQSRLGIHVDQRVISIAQLSNEFDRMPAESMAEGAAGQSAIVTEISLPEDAPSSVSATDSSMVESVSTMESPATASAAPSISRPATSPRSAPVGTRRTIPRVIYQGLESSTREGRVEVRVRLAWQDQEYIGEEGELDGGLGRIRAAAIATLNAAEKVCSGQIRFDLESASTTSALGREYILISAHAASPILGRRPLTLIGAQPLEFDSETTAALATLQAINRILPLALAD